jgi:pyrroline-5-carboxylate reductase
MKHIRKLAFIGGGNMAIALIGGLVKRGLSPTHMWVSDPSAQQRERLHRDHAVGTTAANTEAVADAEVVVLAVKPQHMRAVASGLNATVAAGTTAPRRPPLFISVAAGIPHAALARWLPAHAPIVRAMPNRPALYGYGATGLFAPDGVSGTDRALAESILAAVGSVVWVEHETQMDTVTALSGSGPAYFFAFMEALEAAAHARGLPAKVARELTLATALGAARMATESPESLATLREQVTSKGGTTAAALAVLDAANLRAIVREAVAAADLRSAELAAEYGIP